MSSSILDARESHKEAEDVIGALEDPEDPQVPHHLFQAQSHHVTISSKYLRHKKIVKVWIQKNVFFTCIASSVTYQAASEENILDTAASSWKKMF